MEMIDGIGGLNLCWSRGWSCKWRLEVPIEVPCMDWGKKGGRRSIGLIDTTLPPWFASPLNADRIWSVPPSTIDLIHTDNRWGRRGLYRLSRCDMQLTSPGAATCSWKGVVIHVKCRGPSIGLLSTDVTIECVDLICVHECFDRPYWIPWICLSRCVNWSYS